MMFHTSLFRVVREVSRPCHPSLTRRNAMPRLPGTSLLGIQQIKFWGHVGTPRRVVPVQVQRLAVQREGLLTGVEIGRVNKIEKALASKFQDPTLKKNVQRQ